MSPHIPLQPIWNHGKKTWRNHESINVRNLEPGQIIRVSDWYNILSPNLIKARGSEIRQGYEQLICPAYLSCDDEMKHRKWLSPFSFFLQSREEEMGDRVWQVQKELEELQGRSCGTAEVQTFLTHIHQAWKHLRSVSQLVDVMGPFFHLHRCRTLYLQLVHYIQDWRFRLNVYSDSLEIITHFTKAALNHFFFSSLSCSSGKRLESDGSITSLDWQPNPHAVLRPWLIIWKFTSGLRD